MTNVIVEKPLCFIKCPHCEEKSGRIDHLFDQRTIVRFGPWYCDKCGGEYDGNVDEDNNVTTSKRENKKIITLNLLKIEGKEKNILFIVEGMRFLKDDPDDIQSNTQYFYNEHTCPTNYIGGDVLAIIDGIDTDPHGFAEFIRCVDAPTDFDKDNADWFDLFPEIDIDKGLP